MGKTATTIPRMELCAAVNAVKSSLTNVAEMVSEQNKIKLYSVSKVVLSYINNEERRFDAMFEIECIRKLSQPSHWSFIDTSANPADCTTRSQTSHKLVQIFWLKGAAFLYTKE